MVEPKMDETPETLIEQLRAQLEQARREALEAKREALAAQHGIPVELIALLRAEDPEQLARDAAILARALERARSAQGSSAHAAEPSAPDLSWLRERRSGRLNPFGRGGVRWQDE